MTGTLLPFKCMLKKSTVIIAFSEKFVIFYMYFVGKLCFNDMPVKLLKQIKHLISPIFPKQKMYKGCMPQKIYIKIQFICINIINNFDVFDIFIVLLSKMEMF